MHDFLCFVTYGSCHPYLIKGSSDDGNATLKLHFVKMGSKVSLTKIKYCDRQPAL